MHETAFPKLQGWAYSPAGTANALWKPPPQLSRADFPWKEGERDLSHTPQRKRAQSQMINTIMPHLQSCTSLLEEAPFTAPVSKFGTDRKTLRMPKHHKHPSPTIIASWTSFLFALEANVFTWLRMSLYVLTFSRCTDDEIFPWSCQGIGKRYTRYPRLNCRREGRCETNERILVEGADKSKTKIQSVSATTLGNDVRSCTVVFSDSWVNRPS